MNSAVIHWYDKSDEKVGKVWLLFMNSSRCPLLQLTKQKKKKKKKRNTKHRREIHCYPNGYFISKIWERVWFMWKIEENQIFYNTFHIVHVS